MEYGQGSIDYIAIASIPLHIVVSLIHPVICLALYLGKCSDLVLEKNGLVRIGNNLVSDFHQLQITLREEPSSPILQAPSCFGRIDEKYNVPACLSPCIRNFRSTRPCMLLICYQYCSHCLMSQTYSARDVWITETWLSA